MAHIIISPDPEDGKVQTRLDWKEIGNSFLQKAGLSKHQSVGYLHKDKDHFHLHIVTNRIDVNGKIYRGGHELAMSQRIGDEIATDRGLKRASEIRRERMRARIKGSNIKSIGVTARMREAASNAAAEAWSGGRFHQEIFFKKLKAHGFEVRLSFKKDDKGILTDQVHGYGIAEKGERFINASRIGTEFTLQRLRQENPSSSLNLKVNNEPVKSLIEEELNKCFDAICKNETRFEPQLFLSEVRSNGYSVKEYFNKDTGKLRGYGIEIDNKIINSSELGSGFTLTNLRKRFDELKNLSTYRQKDNPYHIVNDLRVESTLEHKDEISHELRREIDLCLLKIELRDLTSGHRYKTYDEFIKAIEEKGYHVHLRYGEGKLSGYTVHKGIEHYHDKEIGEGEFSLGQLSKRGLFQKNASRVAPEVVESSPHEVVGEVVTKDSLAEKQSVIVPRPNFAEIINLTNVEREGKKNKMEREEARRMIARELANHIKHLISSGRPIDFDKYFSELQTDGYKVLKHLNKETDLIRGYSVEKYGFKFYASEIGKEFTLEFIKETTFSKKMTEEMKQPRRQRLGT